MIRNLKDLSYYLKNLESAFEDPIHKASFKIYAPGITKKEEKLLRTNLKNIPETYLEIVRRYNLLGVSVGYFDCSPGDLYKNLVESLIDANCHDTFFPKEFMEKHRMYQIGSGNTDLVCVTAGTDQFKEGEILLVEEGYDIYNPQDDQIHPLAKDFEQFLIVAGNFDEIHCATIEDNSNWEEKKNEFIERLRLLGVDENYHKAWINVS